MKDKESEWSERTLVSLARAPRDMGQVWTVGNVMLVMDITTTGNVQICVRVQMIDNNSYKSWILLPSYSERGMVGSPRELSFITSFSVLQA